MKAQNRKNSLKKYILSYGFLNITLNFLHCSFFIVAKKPGILKNLIFVSLGKKKTGKTWNLRNFEKSGTKNKFKLIFLRILKYVIKESALKIVRRFAR